ncbi:Exonuclease SbcC [Streptomyces misionensis JCM 4497]
MGPAPVGHDHRPACGAARRLRRQGGPAPRRRPGGRGRDGPLRRGEPGDMPVGAARGRHPAAPRPHGHRLGPRPMANLTTVNRHPAPAPPNPLR